MVYVRRLPAKQVRRSLQNCICEFQSSSPGNASGIAGNIRGRARREVSTFDRRPLLDHAFDIRRSFLAVFAASRKWFRDPAAMFHPGPPDDTASRN
jgi:hypothetical protein